jgi:hypothetical protein
VVDVAEDNKNFCEWRVRGNTHVCQKMDKEIEKKIDGIYDGIYKYLII